MGGWSSEQPCPCAARLRSPPARRLKWMRPARRHRRRRTHPRGRHRPRRRDRRARAMCCLCRRLPPLWRRRRLPPLWHRRRLPPLWHRRRLPPLWHRRRLPPLWRRRRLPPLWRRRRLPPLWRRRRLPPLWHRRRLPPLWRRRQLPLPSHLWLPPPAGLQRSPLPSWLPPCVLLALARFMSRVAAALYCVHGFLSFLSFLSFLPQGPVKCDAFRAQAPGVAVAAGVPPGASSALPAGWERVEDDEVGRGATRAVCVRLSACAAGRRVVPQRGHRRGLVDRPGCGC